jgi:hypothetical protein
MALILLSIAVVWAFMRPPAPIVQPILYNHNLHVEEEGLECIDCHETVEDHSFATIPRIEICQDCHEGEAISESPEEAKLLAHVEREEEIQWNRIYEVPDHVYFSHRRHVSLGELDCIVCHGDVADQVVPAVAPETALSMHWCMDCHKENKVSNDCLACHR